MRKKKSESREEQVERLKKEVERLIEAGELDFMDADHAFEALLRQAEAGKE